MSELLCLGLGYTASVFAARLATDGWRVTGTSRTAAGVAAIVQEGWHGVVFDGATCDVALADAIARATHILVSIPPGDGGDPVLDCLAGPLASAPHQAWIGYLSTVGVYGDHAGGLVDETTPPAPATERGRRRVAAETAWLQFARETGRRVEIFRLPGIYGPDRSALDTVRAGTARRIDKAGQVFNRIHVADIATALFAALAGPHRHAVYNLADAEPGPPGDVVDFAAGLLGVTPPPIEPFETAAMTPMARSFYGESKRVSNRRMLEVLGVRLAYPSYREGLAAILAGEA